MRITPQSKRSQRGMAVVLVLITALVGFVMVAGLLGLSTQNNQLTWRTMAQERADSATDAALETAFSLMVRDLHTVGVAGVSSNVSGNNYDAAVASIVSANISNATVSPFSIVSLVSTNAGEERFVITAQTQVLDPAEGRSRATMELRMLDVPVTGFSLCYDVDLEHYPWHNWTVGGPVYCGQTAYLCPVSSSTLTFSKGVFAVNGIVEGPHPNDPTGNPMDGTIDYQSDKDVHAPTMVQPPPPPGATNRMHWILEQPGASDYGTPTGSRRFVNKADVVVTLTDSGIEVKKGPKHGNVLVSTNLPAGVMSQTSFQDWREGRTAQVVVVDAAQIPGWMSSGALFGGAAPTHPTLYIDDRRTWGSGSFGAVRVDNGAVLGANGFTLAAPNPLYVRGNFNTTNPKPVMLAGDAITVLSGSWNDGDGALPITDPARAASDTTVNAALVTGIVPAGNGYGSGWVANVVRLLENWNGRTLGFNGSIAVLYCSESATGVWYHGTYYRAPGVRTFSFTNLFATLGQADVPTMKMAWRGTNDFLTPL